MNKSDLAVVRQESVQVLFLCLHVVLLLLHFPVGDLCGIAVAGR